MLFDRHYKRMFSNHELVEHLAEGYLGGGWSAAVRWETLQQWPTERISPEGVRRENDLVWRVSRRDGSDLYIFLAVEFQREVDQGMAVRMNEYSAMLLRELWEHREAGPFELPEIALVVVYTGQAPWTAPTSLAEMRRGWPETLSFMGGFGQQMKFVLVSARDASELAGGDPNLADGLFRIERSNGEEELKGASVWMDEALRVVANAQLEKDVVRWFNDVYLGRRLTEWEARVSSLSEVPEMLDQYFDTWADRFIAQGKAEARAEARAEAKGEVSGRKALLLRLVRTRYGDECVVVVESALQSIDSIPRLDDIGEWIVTCGNAESLVARIRRLSG